MQFNSRTKIILDFTFLAKQTLKAVQAFQTLDIGNVKLDKLAQNYNFKIISREFHY